MKFYLIIVARERDNRRWILS